MKRRCIVLFLLLSIFVSIIFYEKIYNKNIVEEKNMSKNIVNNNNFLSMMLEQNSGAGDYELSTLNDFPTDGYIFNDLLSKCENGSELSWDDEKKKVVLKGNVSDKCYVYFDKYNLPVIKNVVVSNITSTSLTINVTSEKGTNDIASYYYSISFNSNDTNFVNDVSISYSFSNLISNTTYYIKVYAVDLNGKSSDIYSLSQKTKVVYTWGKYDIKETTNYKVQTNSGEGRIYTHYYSQDEWESADLTAYSSYYVKSDGTISCDLKWADIFIPSKICTNCPINNEKEYRFPTDDEINEYFSPYVGGYICDGGKAMIIKSNMTIDFSFGSGKYWAETDSLTTVADGTTKSKGNYIEDVTSDSSNTYPSNGVLGSYWYVRK